MPTLEAHGSWALENARLSHAACKAERTCGPCCIWMAQLISYAGESRSIEFLMYRWGKAGPGQSQVQVRMEVAIWTVVLIGGSAFLQSAFRTEITFLIDLISRRLRINKTGRLGILEWNKSVCGEKDSKGQKEDSGPASPLHARLLQRKRGWCLSDPSLRKVIEESLTSWVLTLFSTLIPCFLALI